MVYKVVNMCQFYYELAYTSIRFFLVPQLYKNVLTSLTLGAMEYMNGLPDGLYYSLEWTGICVSSIF